MQNQIVLHPRGYRRVLPPSISPVLHVHAEADKHVFPLVFRPHYTRYKGAPPKHQRRSGWRNDEFVSPVAGTAFVEFRSSVIEGTVREVRGLTVKLPSFQL